MSGTRIVPGMPALLVEGKKKILAITDVHIGFEASLAANQVFTGKDTSGTEMAKEVTRLIDAHRPDLLVLLGDLKSSIKRISKSEWDDVPAFLDKVSKKCETVLVPGNHDSNIERLVPDGVAMTGPAGLIEEDTLFTHGHAMPSENYSHASRIVMGHTHPVYFEEGSVLNGQRVWVSIMAQKGDLFPSKRGQIEVIIMPSFNRYFFATRKKQASPPPIIRRMKECEARIATLDGSIIGDESAISRVI